MRRLARWAALLLCATGLAPGSAADPGPGGFASPNVTWVATIPLDAPGIGGRVVTVGGQTRFYVTGSRGLSIYDVTKPELPVPLSTLPLPHWENEAVAVSDDGATVVVSTDTGLFFLIDTTDVRVPKPVKAFRPGAHTSVCADPKCHYLYSSSGHTFDLRDRSNPVEVEPGWAEHTGIPGAHYVNRDAAGLLTVDGGTRYVLDPRQDPTRPKLLTRGKTRVDGIPHNNVRPNAERWRPRRPSDRSRLLKPGELLVGGGETLGGGCDSGAAGVTTWSMANFDKGVPMTLLDTFTPRGGNYADGYAAVHGLGCSSHWFDYRNGVLAAGWYENGTHFLKVDERTGKLTEVGWFQPVDGVTWGAWWVGENHVYTLDATRGIDVLRFDRSKPPADPAAAWSRPVEFSAVAERERYLCRTAGR